MSSASLAKKRRANVPLTTLPSAPAPEVRVPQTPLTLPQILNILDTRINKLEMKEKMEPNDEYEHRFEMLVTQIAELKEMLLKLQMYTMDVNKKLLEQTA